MPNQITQALEALTDEQLALIEEAWSKAEQETAEGESPETEWSRYGEHCFRAALSSAAPDPTVNVGGVMLPVNTGRIGSSAAPSAAEPVANRGALNRSELITAFAAKWSGYQKVEAGEVLDWIMSQPLAAPPAPQAASEPVALPDFASAMCGYGRIKDGQYQLLSMRSTSVMADGEIHPLYAFSDEEIERLDRATLPNGLTEAQTRATALVAGLSGDAEREALTDEQIDVLLRQEFGGHYDALDEVATRLRNILRQACRVVVSALHSTGKPDGDGALDRDAAIDTWHKHCDKFSSVLGAAPASPVIDAMLDFASAVGAATADAPVAEPVAWYSIDDNGGLIFERSMPKVFGLPWFPLYTRPPAPEEAKDAALTYVECRECRNCHHIGINDASGTTAACSECEWHGETPANDECEECGRTGTMCAACPECGGVYELLAHSNVTAPDGSTYAMTHEAISQALHSGSPLNHGQRAALLKLVSDDKRNQNDYDASMKDATRLDWINANVCSVYSYGDGNLRISWCNGAKQATVGPGNFHTWREVIDAALSQGGGA